MVDATLDIGALARMGPPEKCKWAERMGITVITSCSYVHALIALPCSQSTHATWQRIHLSVMSASHTWTCVAPAESHYLSEPAAGRGLFLVCLDFAAQLVYFQGLLPGFVVGRV